MTAYEIFDKAFAVPRQKRSDAYKQGVLDVLKLRIHGEKIPFRYVEGTAQADAYYAGMDEGHRLANEHKTDQMVARNSASDVAYSAFAR